MKNALLLHGTDGTPQGIWFPWLKNELEKKGFRIWAPQLPHAEKPNIERYNKYIFANKDWKFNEESLLIGHSSGAVEILGLLQQLSSEVVVDKCILIGSFKNDLGWDSLKELFQKPFNFEKIKKHAREFTFFHSDNDPYCPLEGAEYLAKQVNGKLIIKKGQGHFSGEKVTIPEVLEEV